MLSGFVYIITIKFEDYVSIWFLKAFDSVDTHTVITAQNCIVQFGLHGTL